jgi:hypothetical protein
MKENVEVSNIHLKLGVFGRVCLTIDAPLFSKDESEESSKLLDCIKDLRGPEYVKIKSRYKLEFAVGTMFIENEFCEIIDGVINAIKKERNLDEIVVNKCLYDKKHLPQLIESARKEQEAFLERVVEEVVTVEESLLARFIHAMFSINKK